MLTQTPPLAIGSVLVASVLAAGAPFLFEHGARQLQGRIIDFLMNPYILAGMATYLVVMVFFTYAFRLGGTVRVLYPIYATTFIWAAVLAWFRHGDPIQPVHGVGMLLLMAGIICMSW